MTAPVPEEESEPLGLTEPPDDEHDSEAPDRSDADPEEPEGDLQAENAETAQDQPSQ
ncbi:hypothetical protein [Nocardioides sambongensis]|uniref:hypothetical protein n=1 Tax=Nocardioides sambongensis TaxID=2589074 RepID=UPI0015E837F8|nr:hypothetical protein [Nocardioides sambongensis]